MPSPRSRHSDPQRLPWLVRLRWAAVIAQAGCVAVVALALRAPLPIVPLLSVIGVTAVSNAALSALARSSHAPRLIGPALLLDTVSLTALLYLSGGPANPFSVLYLVQVTLAAVALSTRWTWGIVLASVLGYGALFAAHEPLPATLGGHGAHAHAHAHAHAEASGDVAFDAHLQGMWLALTVAASLIAFFVSRVSTALAEERARADRSARLAALTTLAAGAAHELATPLSTIKLAASELERALADRPADAALAADARLVRSEVERSRAVLDRLAASSGELAGESPERVPVRELADAVRAELDAERAARVRIRDESGGRALRLPRRAVTTALSNLVRNALDASGTEEVDISIREHGDAGARELHIAVHDRGEGMSPEVLARAGDPFFTTKAAGRGMGLGVFLARALAEQLGGQLELESAPERGTTATIILPCPDAAPEGART